MTTNVINKGWFNPISLTVLLVLISVSIILSVLQIVNVQVFVLLILFSGLLATSIRIADQWERAVVLRMGKFKGLRGPGPFMIIPIIDSVSAYIDQRVRVSAFKAEQTLTKDTVPVNVDAVVYWTVWDVEKAALEVQEYQRAIEHIAQHSTGHSEAIITEDPDAAALFCRCVDSAAVYVNASTRFTDGGEFGLGCEMGISTQKLHARGPLGLRELCTFKYLIRGQGQIR